MGTLKSQNNNMRVSFFSVAVLSVLSHLSAPSQAIQLDSKTEIDCEIDSFTSSDVPAIAPAPAVAKVSAETEAEAGAVIDAITDSYNEALAGLNINSDAPAETDAPTVVDSDSEADADADADVEVEAAVGAHVKAFADSDSDLDADVDLDLGADLAAGLDAGLSAGAEVDSELKAAGDTEVVAGMEVRHQMADGKPSEGIPVEVTSPSPSHKAVVATNFVPKKPGDKPTKGDDSLTKALESQGVPPEVIKNESIPMREMHLIYNGIEKLKEETDELGNQILTVDAPYVPVTQCKSEKEGTTCAKIGSGAKAVKLQLEHGSAVKIEPKTPEPPPKEPEPQPPKPPGPVKQGPPPVSKKEKTVEKKAALEALMKARHDKK